MHSASTDTPLPRPTVLAAIVLYHPDPDDLTNALTAISPQVDRILLVDNGATGSDGDMKYENLTNSKIRYIASPGNPGLAAALNKATDHAGNAGADFLLLLDQDSFVTEGFVDSQISYLAESAENNSIGIVGCTIINRVTAQREACYLDSDGNPALLQTSGSLVRLAMMRDVGKFREDFFIDYVDYEFSLRTHKYLWRMGIAPSAKLLHKPGNNIPIRKFGRNWIAVRARPDRHYYMVRNYILLARTYPSEKNILFKLLLVLIKVEIKALLIEPYRKKIARAVLEGLWHGLRNAGGRRP